MKPKSKPKPQQGRAIELLIEGRTIPETATELGVTRATVWRWTQEPDFVARLAAARAGRLTGALDRLEGAVSDALEAMVSILRDESQPAAVRLKAAESILSRAGLAGPKERKDPREPDPVGDLVGDLMGQSKPVCPYDDG